ncbi:hypothetical protein WBP06_13820 [Novosphingobium sp. BL-8H]|uniref:hypothetical protein n=1 Tax=Novosphingobium sp. BL-8H TaxID=3127640 RepID=UPI0037582F18
MLLIPSILLATSALATSGGAIPSEAVAAKACTVPQGWSEIATRHPRYVVFGELHGTQESPAFLGNLACGLASRGERILVAIELQSAADDALQQAWKLPDDRFVQAASAAGFAHREDGVASQAMFAMLVRLHGLKEAGLPIDVVAFNGTADQARRFPELAAQGPHEAAQAENIREAASRGTYDNVLVLVGNFHAGKVRHGDGAESFDPMAVRLASFGSVVSLNMRYATGTAWNCLVKPGMKLVPGHPLPDDALDCGNHSVQSSVDLQRAPFIQLGAFPGAKADSAPLYDGFFWLGPISGSAPFSPTKKP